MEKEKSHKLALQKVSAVAKQVMVGPVSSPKLTSVWLETMFVP